MKLALILCALPLWGQSADKILAQHVAALGNAKTLKARTAVEYRGEGRDIATGERGAFTLSLRAPNLIYLEFAAGAGGWSAADNGKSAWRRDSGQAPRTLSGREALQLRTLGYFLGQGFADARKDKWFAKYAGSAEIDGHKADAIEMSNQSTELAGARVKFWFDAATHMMLKQETRDGAESMVFGGYHPVNGVAEPSRLTYHQGSQTLEIALDKITHNPAAGARTLDYPASTIQDKPDVAKLFEEVVQHQSDLDKLRRLYSCTLDEISDAVDIRGRVTKTTDEQYYVFYLGSHEFRKRVATDGKPLSAAEMKKEDERIAKRVEEESRRDAERARKAKPASAPSPEDDDSSMVHALLKVMQFTNFRREPFHGREVLVFDFAANPNHKPQSLLETLASKFIGTMWVDENDHQVARAQARTVAAFKIGGGLLVSVSAGSSFLVEQEKINGEIWLPVFEENHVAGRVLFLSGKDNEVDRYSDYRKFTADSKVTFGK